MAILGRILIVVLAFTSPLTSAVTCFIDQDEDGYWIESSADAQNECGESYLVGLTSTEYNAILETGSLPYTASQVVEAVGAGFITVLPLVLVIFGGRAVLSMLFPRGTR